MNYRIVKNALETYREKLSAIRRELSDISGTRNAQTEIEKRLLETEITLESVMNEIKKGKNL